MSYFIMEVMELLLFLFRGSSRKNKIYSVINSVIRCPFERVFLLLLPRVQGKWAFADPKFINILRNDIGFDGSVMTDAWSERSLDDGEETSCCGFCGSIMIYMISYIKSHATCLKLKVHMRNFLNPPLPFKPRLYFFSIRFKIYCLVAVSFTMHEVVESLRIGLHRGRRLLVV